MFDLEQQIRQWRQGLPAEFRGRPEVIDELESHLRDEVQRLVAAGQPGERAWEAALGRLGSPQQLAAEFAKVPAAGAWAWLPARVVLVALGLIAVALLWLMATQLQQGKFGPLLAGHVLAITMGYTAAFAFGALAVWAILTRAVSGWDARRAGSLRAVATGLAVGSLVLTGVGVVLGGWWAQDHLGRFWGWDWREIGGASVLAWNGLMLGCLWRRPAAGLLALVMGPIANVVVSLSWFGPALLEGRHSYGFGGLGVLLMAFVIAQLLVLPFAFVPAGRLARQRA